MSVRKGLAKLLLWIGGVSLATVIFSYSFISDWKDNYFSLLVSVLRNDLHQDYPAQFSMLSYCLAPVLAIIVGAALYPYGHTRAEEPAPQHWQEGEVWPPPPRGPRPPDTG